MKKLSTGFWEWLILNLKILLPAGVLLEQEVKKVTAEAENGYFTMLPRHIDYVAALVPGIFSYLTPDNVEHFIALDEGVVVKQGERVYVSATRAVPGDDLEQLQDIVESELKVLDESEKKARSVMSRLEADTLRRFTRLGGER